MKETSIALFKEYIEGKGMTTPFINMYRQNRIKTNPHLIEDYLRLCDESTVCTRGFYHFANSKWGFDFWQKMQDGFEAFLQKNRNEYENAKWWTFKGKFKILRTNWDNAKHWKLESLEAAKRRFGIQEQKEEKPIEIVSFKSDDVEKEIETTHDILSEYEFIDISPKRQLKDNEASVNVRNKKYTLTLNKRASIAIHNHKLSHAALLRNTSGDIVVMFNKADGAKILDGIDKNGNCVINNKQLVLRIVAFLNIKNDYAIIDAIEIANTCDYIIYKLSKQKH